MTDDLVMSDAELVTMIRVAHRNDNYRLHRSLYRRFDNLKQEMYQYHQETNASEHQITIDLMNQYELSCDDVEWIISGAISEDTPLSLEVITIIRRAKKMGASVEDICLLVDKPAFKVKEALEGQECNCLACQMRRKLEAGETPDVEMMMRFISELKRFGEENEE